MKSDTVGRPMEILLLEDSLDDARLTFEAFKSGDVQCRLTWLRDGEEAMEFLDHRGKFARAPRPDLILLDLGLPKKDGREVLAEIKAREELHSIPVVVMTSSRAHEDMLKTELLQVEGYLLKPVDLGKFLTLVRELKRFWMTDVILPVS